MVFKKTTTFRLELLLIIIHDNAVELFIGYFKLTFNKFYNIIEQNALSAHLMKRKRRLRILKKNFLKASPQRCIFNFTKFRFHGLQDHEVRVPLKRTIHPFKIQE